MGENSINFNHIPITALTNNTKKLLCVLLNPTKIFLTDEGLPRDWRGLAQLSDIPGEVIPAIMSSADQTNAVLSYWNQQNSQTANLHNLQLSLEIIDRFDVLDDIKDYLDSDAKDYINNKHETKSNLSMNSPTILASTPDQDVLTVHDAYLSQQGYSNPQMYDAFVLYADEDIEFVEELVAKMEACEFKLFIKDRDLIGGLTSQHTALLRLISERCTRLIVIISPDFLQSPANTFLIDYAQAYGIEQGQRKIIPCLYKRCTLPPQLSYYFLLDYQRSGRLWNFWDKLRDSLRANPTPLTNSQRAIIREIEPEIKSIPLSENRYISRKLAITSSPNIPVPHRKLELPQISISPPDAPTANSITSSLPAYSPPLRQTSSMVDITNVNNNLDNSSLSITMSSNTKMCDSVSDITSMVSNISDPVMGEKTKKKWFTSLFSSSKNGKNDLRKKKKLKKQFPLGAD